jgi:hypothetical protein
MVANFIAIHIQLLQLVVEYRQQVNCCCEGALQSAVTRGRNEVAEIVSLFAACLLLVLLLFLQSLHFFTLFCFVHPVRTLLMY